MDVFYEESSIIKDGGKSARKYKITHIISRIFLAIWIIALIFGFSFVPINGWILWGFFCVWLIVVWYVLQRLKRRFNVNYDYCFVSGELRIAKVFNIHRRRLVTRLDPDDIIQIGDVDNTSFEGLRADPNTKTVLCTSNTYATEGKFFMYVLASDNGKKLYVLECREELLMHMMRFLKRSVLEHDYVPQEKKAR